MLVIKQKIEIEKNKYVRKCCYRNYIQCNFLELFFFNKKREEVNCKKEVDNKKTLYSFLITMAFIHPHERQTLCSQKK